MEVFLRPIPAIRALAFLPQDSLHTILTIAITSRVFVLALALLFGVLVPDHQADAHQSSPVLHLGILDRLVAGGLGGLASWDGVWFLEIAEKGYSFEQQHAFFPLLPGLMRLVDQVLLAPLTSFLFSPRTRLLLAGVLISNLSFVLAVVALWRLTLLQGASPSLAHASALLFAFNPASIFFSSLYTESLFTALTFAGLLALYSRRHLIATLLLALASATRSNGLVAVGFVVHAALREAFTPPSPLPLLRGLFMALFIAAPYVAFQGYGWSLYCPGPSWCTSPLPNLYGHVQDAYWGVGWLRYWTLQQLPNFLLAAPVLLASLTLTLAWLKTHPAALRTLGLLPTLPSSPPLPFLDRAELLPWVLHWLALTLLALFVMHVQVATRFLASQCAPFYWFLASLVLESPSSSVSRLTRLWFAAYLLLGALLFPNFLPWT